MQQEASRKLGYTTKRTMSVAQGLYEAGLITYMRTDSTRISEEASIKDNQPSPHNKNQLDEISIKERSFFNFCLPSWSQYYYLFLDTIPNQNHIDTFPTNLQPFCLPNVEVGYDIF